MIDFKIFNCLKLIYYFFHQLPALYKFSQFAIPIYRYIHTSLLQNYYKFVIYQKKNAKISIKILTFAEN